jgi:phosphate starvation-inducible PhoH-like protein
MKLARDHEKNRSPETSTDFGPRASDPAHSGFGHGATPAFLTSPGSNGDVAYSQSTETDEGASQKAAEHPHAGTRRHGPLSGISFKEQKTSMGKRSARSKKQHRDDDSIFQLHAIPPRGEESPSGWDPVDQHRDQSYIRHVKPRSENQRMLMEAIETSALTLALGPAGTGKTYLAIACAVKALEAGEIDRIVLSRPAIEAGETLGYLPGTMEEKMSPYLRPLYDALADRMGGKRLRSALADGTIEIAPIAYMRGRTLNNAFVVIDEAQNCTYGQIKMLLTRLGWHSTMVITGDPDQSDLLPGVSGLADIANRLSTLDDIQVVRLAQHDVVRHPLVACMLTAL